jgi:hypothetical protein
MRLGMAIGGGIAFVASLVYFAWRYAVAFDEPAATPATFAPAVFNFFLFTVFALHHSLFARAGIKTALARVVPPALERSLYVWIASVLFLVVCAAWRPVPGVLWSLEGSAAWLLRGVQLFAVVFTVAAARRLDVLELSGIHQALALGQRTESAYGHDPGRSRAVRPRPASNLSGLDSDRLGRPADERHAARFRSHEHAVSSGRDPVRGTRPKASVRRGVRGICEEGPIQSPARDLLAGPEGPAYGCLRIVFFLVDRQLVEEDHRLV